MKKSLQNLVSCHFGLCFCTQFSKFHARTFFFAFLHVALPRFSCMNLRFSMRDLADQSYYQNPILLSVNTSSCRFAQFLVHENFIKSIVLNLFLALCVFSCGSLGILAQYFAYELSNFFYQTYLHSKSGLLSTLFYLFFVYEQCQTMASCLAK